MVSRLSAYMVPRLSLYMVPRLSIRMMPLCTREEELAREKQSSEDSLAHVKVVGPYSRVLNATVSPLRGD